MPLILPNTIDPDTTADAVEVEQNNGVLQQYINTNLISRDGSVAMQQPLLLAGDPSQPNQAANKGYVDGKDVAQDLVINAKVNRAGDTMTGALTGPLFLSVAQSGEGHAATRLDWVQGQIASVRADYAAADTSYYNSLVARMDTQDLAYYNNYTVNKINRTGDTMSGVLYAGADPFNGQPGSSVHPTGVMGVNLHDVSKGNIYLFHSGGAFANNCWYMVFCGQTSTTTLGAIIQSGSSAVSYYSGSDYRLKDELGPVDDPAGRVMQLQPKHLRWKSDGTEFDGFLAHEVAEVVPTAVSGEKDAVDEDGNIATQMLDSGILIPLLTAALQDALTRIEALEAA